MGNLKVGVRLGIAFGLLLALMLAAVGVAYLGIRSTADQASRLERENIALLNAANAMRAAQQGEAVAIRDFVSLPDVASQRAAQGSLKANGQAFTQAAAQLDALAAGAANEAQLRQRLGTIRAAAAKAAAKLRQALELSDGAEYQEAQNVVYRELRPLQAAIAGELQALVDQSNGLAQERAQAARAAAVQSEQRLLVAVVAALLLGLGATFRITRDIARPLGVAVQAAERVAQGDLTLLDVRPRRDETGRVLTALGDMQQRLNALVHAIRRGAQAVSLASEQIAGGNTDLAARTEEQAASLEETAASVEELTATVQQTSEHAAQASELARRAAELAVGGGDAVGGVLQSMDGIQASSRKVSEIIGLMDDLAFQTNLLALNAAVEAARAGEQGRGFGVVAAQVRVLAQRSAEASKDIKKLVSEAVAQADNGARAAGRASEAMGKVVSVAQEVAQVVTGIATASQEQRSGIEQVNTTLAQLDGVTQSNAGLVQQINGLTEALLAQARELVEATSRFRLDDDASPARAVGSVTAASNPVPLAWSPQAG